MKKSCLGKPDLNSIKLHQSELGSCWLNLHDIQNNGDARKKVVLLIKVIIYLAIYQFSN